MERRSREIVIWVCLACLVVLSVSMLLYTVVRTCDEDYNPLYVVQKAGYLCYPIQYGRAPKGINWSEMEVIDNGK